MSSPLPAPVEKPLWAPGIDRIDRANLSRFMRFVREESGKADLNSYSPLYHFSIDQPAQFWTLLWDFVGIRGSGDRTPVLDDQDGMPFARWFPGVSLNFAQNLLRFDDERIALRCHADGGELESVSYAQLQRRVAALAAALRDAGLAPGDAVAALLPNLPGTMVAMLATASVGGVWFTCPPELPRADAQAVLEAVAPKFVLVAGPGAAFVPAITSARILSMDDAAFVAPFADAEHEFTALPFNHPLYLTRARGADRASELLVHGAGGTLLQHLKELVLHVDLKREDKVFFHSGNHEMAWYWLMSALATGATLVLHAGEEFPPGEPGLWDLVDEYGISVLGLHTHWLEACAQSGSRPVGSHRLLSLKTLLTAGASLPPETYDFVYAQVKPRLLLAPITTGGDTLACFALGAPLLPVWRGEIPCRALGMKVEVLDASGEPMVGVEGDLACSAPFPSMPLGFLDDADGARFVATYFSRQPGRWSRGERATLTARESLVLRD